MAATTIQAQDFNFDEVTYTPQATTFKLFAPSEARRVQLRLYKDGDSQKAMKTVKLQKTGQDLWTATVKGDLKDRFYTFDMGRGECPGVFAKAVGVNGRKGCILDLKPRAGPKTAAR